MGGGGGGGVMTETEAETGGAEVRTVKGGRHTKSRRGTRNRAWGCPCRPLEYFIFCEKNGNSFTEHLVSVSCPIWWYGHKTEIQSENTDGAFSGSQNPRRSFVGARLVLTAVNRSVCNPSQTRWPRMFSPRARPSRRLARSGAPPPQERPSLRVKRKRVSAAGA